VQRQPVADAELPRQAGDINGERGNCNDVAGEFGTVTACDGAAQGGEAGGRDHRRLMTF
jgi:hypothetical protein